MFKINPNPTFKADVEIPIHGEKKPVKVGFIFKHKTRKQLQEYLNKTKELEDVEAIMLIAEGWEGIEDEFNEESIEALTQNYHGSAGAILNAYLSELMQAKAKN